MFKDHKKWEGEGLGHSQIYKPKWLCFCVLVNDSVFITMIDSVFKWLVMSKKCLFIFKEHEYLPF